MTRHLGHPGGSPEIQLGPQQRLDSRDPQVLQPGLLPDRKRHVVQVGQRVAGPQLERRAKLRRPRCHLGLLEERTALPGQLDEPDSVDVLGRHHQRPPGRTSQDPRSRPVRRLLPWLIFWLSVGDRAAQTRDVRLQRQRRPCRRLIVPELIDQPVQRHRAVHLEGQQSEHRPLLAAPQPQPNAVQIGRNRSEKPHPHPRSMRPARPAPKTQRGACKPPPCRCQGSCKPPPAWCLPCARPPRQTSGSQPGDRAISLHHHPAPLSNSHDRATRTAVQPGRHHHEQPTVGTRASSW
jgi:hypothetical protein